MKHIIPISGKDSLATAIIQTAHQPEKKYQYIFNCTGWELPPVFDWLKKVENHFNSTIEIISANLTKIIEHNKILPSQRVRFCTKYAKIFPLRDYIGKEKTTVYYGLRADEPFRKGHDGAGHIIPIFPLRDFGMGIAQVWAINEKYNLLPPFFHWPEMEKAVIDRMGLPTFQSAIAHLAPWDFQTLFSWKWRQFNCAACIFSRQYEIIGLYEFYPDIFEHIANIEESTGSAEFTFQFSKSMREIIKHKNHIINRRANQITKILYKLLQLNIFEDHRNPIEQTSCGLFCGK